MATQRIIIPVQSAKIVGSTADGSASYIDNPAGIDGGQNTWALLFDASTDESATFNFQVPGNYTGSPSVNLMYTCAVAANDIGMRIDTKVISSGNPNSTSVTGFSTETSFTQTVPSSAGFISEITAAISTGGIAADRFAILRLSRQTTSANDTAAGDAEIRAITMEYST